MRLKRARLKIRDRVRIRTLVTKDRVNNGQEIVVDQTLSIDLIVVKMTDFNVILGMDWLAENRASIDCRKKKVVFSPFGEI